jgi:hypothetical protein
LELLLQPFQWWDHDRRKRQFGAGSGNGGGSGTIPDAGNYFLRVAYDTVANNQNMREVQYQP